jgi:uncharacterized protein (DUF1330 family)
MAYWITCYRAIKDPDKLAAYAELAPPAVASAAAISVAACRKPAYEAGQKERIVISEFPSLDTAINAHGSPGYQQALRALGDGAVRDIRIIEGLE